MTGPGGVDDRWADPATPTEPGAPYAGPPATAPPVWPPTGSPPGWSPPAYGWPGGPAGAPWGPPVAGPYGSPAPWALAPRRPRTPGQVIASTVLAFVQAALVLIASLYVWFFASVLELATAGAPEALDAGALATEGTVLSVVGLLSAVLLVTAGVLALNRRDRPVWYLLAGAHALQLALCGYWLIRLLSLADDVPEADADGLLAGSTLLFAAAPAVGLGLLAAGTARRWFAPTGPSAA